MVELELIIAYLLVVQHTMCMLNNSTHDDIIKTILKKPKIYAHVNAECDILNPRQVYFKQYVQIKWNNLLICVTQYKIIKYDWFSCVLTQIWFKTIRIIYVIIV